jgi:ABC-type transport system substrate-binding protein
MNFSGLNDPGLDKDLDLARNTADLSTRVQDYGLADQRLAALLPAIPLYQQVIVNTYSSSLHGVVQNDLVPDFDIAAWSCTAGDCEG